MGKRKPYRIRRLNRLDRGGVLDDVREQHVVVGIDVAKTKMVAVVMDQCDGVLETVGWEHPAQTREFVAFVSELGAHAESVDVVMEPSGVYGDALRVALQQAGHPVYRVSPKQTKDALELYDGVPSSHDAKSSAVVAWVHLHGRSMPWPLASPTERRMKAALRVLELHNKQLHQNANRLEALTARHWPELPRLLMAGCSSYLQLLVTYGGPAGVRADPTGAASLLKKLARGQLSTERIEVIVASASTTLGVPQVDEECWLVQAVARETRHNRLEERAARRRVGELAMAIPSTARLAPVIGAASAAVVVAATGDPLAYDSARGLLKSLGLNLRERSSGEKQNAGLHITKRGSGAARRVLHMAALRLLQTDPIVAAWYAKKVARDGGRTKLKAVVAVTRKLVLALWHVARGAPFDASRLFDTRRLKLAQEVPM